MSVLRSSRRETGYEVIRAAEVRRYETWPGMRLKFKDVVRSKSTPRVSVTSKCNAKVNATMAVLDEDETTGLEVRIARVGCQLL